MQTHSPQDVSLSDLIYSAWVHNYSTRKGLLYVRLKDLLDSLLRDLLVIIKS